MKNIFNKQKIQEKSKFVDNSNTIKKFKKKNIIAFVEPEDVKTKELYKNKIIDKFVEISKEKNEKPLEVTSFGKPITDMIKSTFKIDDEEYSLNREDFQLVELDIARKFKEYDDNIFLEHFIKENYFKDNIIIKTVKHYNELKFLLDCNAYLIILENNEDTSNYYEDYLEQKCIQNTKNIKVNNKLIVPYMFEGKELKHVKFIDRIFTDFKGHSKNK